MSKTNERIFKEVMSKLLNALKYIGDKPFLCVDKYKGGHTYTYIYYISVNDSI